MASNSTNDSGNDITCVKTKLDQAQLLESIRIPKWKNLTQLDLSNSALSSLPDRFSDLVSLKILFLSNCNFEVFPSQLAKCQQLEMVAFRSNGMSSIPEDAFPPRLRWLILTDNQLQKLPNSIGKCDRLQKCMLSGNALECLPEAMASCRKLGLLRLSANRLTSLPSWLFELPELAFLSYAGNPLGSTCQTQFQSTHEESPDLPNIPWASLEVDSGLLGEGASGVIHKAIFNQQVVAAKIFRSAVTSDGTPTEELRTCIRAGAHPNLINSLGRIVSHPEHKPGLLMQLIPPEYRTLGLPPSMASCTRDCFDDVRTTTTMTLSQGVRILKSVAAAAVHLHDRGIAHGDLYAHNILFSENGHALLCDFGAATMYKRSNRYYHGEERLEVCAFGHLIEDVWGLLRRNLGFCRSELRAASELESLHQRCINRDVRRRNSFLSIKQTLDGIEEGFEGKRVA